MPKGDRLKLKAAKFGDSWRIIKRTSEPNEV